MYRYDLDKENYKYILYIVTWALFRILLIMRYMGDIKISK